MSRDREKINNKYKDDFSNLKQRLVCVSKGKMLKLLLLGALVAFATSEKVTYDGYKVYRVTPRTEKQLELLQSVESPSKRYSFWRKPSHLHQSADVMVEPTAQSQFLNFLNQTRIEHSVYIENVQELINQENPHLIEEGFGWKKYHTLDEIYAWLDSLALRYPDNVQVVVGGKSYEGRQIKGVKLSFGPSKPGVFIEGGMHAREWISPATVTYILNEFLTSRDPEIRRLAEKHDWYIFPSFNPDGYVYSHTTNRLWRKTRSPTSNPDCPGVDGNRNWDYKWMNGGASSNPCDETYAGNKPFSEIEMRSMSEYITSLRGKIFAYIAFHSYSQLLMFPYGHTTQHLDNYNETYSMGKKAIEALSKRYGTEYQTGNLGEAIYIHSGISIDWAKATFKLPLSFVYELRDTGRYGFVLPADQIIPNAEEILDSLVAMFKEATRFGYPKPQN